MGRALAELYRRQPVYAALGAALLLSAPLLVLLELVDPRTVDGIGVWVKPVKFAVSLGLYALTLAFFVPWMRSGDAGGRISRLVVALVAVAVIYETGWLWAASALGIRSHFNMDGGLFTILYPVAGIMAVILVLGPLTIGLSVLKGRQAALNPAMSEAIGWGLVLTSLLTLIAALPMSNPFAALGGTKFGPGEGLFGWRVPGSDLRAAHFFATHALHALPLAGFVISRVMAGPVGVALVRLVAAAYAAGVLWLALGVFTGRDLPGFLVSPF